MSQPINNSQNLIKKVSKKPVDFYGAAILDILTIIH
jgi:hypothetical protein